MLFSQLGWDSSSENVNLCLEYLDKNSTDTIEFHEFLRWKEFAWDNIALVKADDMPRKHNLQRRGSHAELRRRQSKASMMPTFTEDEVSVVQAMETVRGVGKADYEYESSAVANRSLQLTFAGCPCKRS